MNRLIPLVLIVLSCAPAMLLADGHGQAPDSRPGGGGG